MDLQSFLVGVSVGAYLGWGYRRIWSVVRYNLGRRDAEPPAPRPAAPRLVRVGSTVDSAPQTDDHRAQWDSALITVALWGDLCQWSERAMLAEGVASRPSIRRYRGLMAENGLLVVSERGGTEWAGGWDRHRLRASLRHRLIALPYPARPPWPLRRAWLAAQTAQGGAVAQAV